jgi:hypothetical protein
LNTVDNSYLLGLFGGSASNASLFGALANAGAAAAASPVTAAPSKTAPTPPWKSASAPPASDLVKAALSGRSLINENATQLDLANASEDYRKLFTVYQGLNSLKALADRMTAKGVSDSEKAQLRRAFASGLNQVGGYVDGLKLDQLRLTRGAAMSKDQAQVGVKRNDTSYATKPLFEGAPDAAVPAFDGDVRFNLAVKGVNSTRTVSFDLSEMGSTPRSMNNVVAYLNGKLEAAGVVTRFAAHRTPAEPQTVKVGNTTVTLPAKPDQWSLDLRGDVSETLTFSAVDTAEAVYVGQLAGKPAETKTTTTGGVTTTTTTKASTVNAQLLKFQTDTAPGAAPPDPVAGPGASNWVPGRSFADTLGPEVKAIRATATGADGSVYVLADVTGTTDGQTIKGARDVALQKYDSAGNLVYTRTLGAQSTATGLGLAVSADGKVAVAGSITGGLDQNATGTDAKTADSFVTLYNTDGEEQWTQRRAARDEDEAQAVSFGADGSVYVAGRARSAMPGSDGALGGWDGYLEGFSATGTAQFTTQFGTTADDRVGGLAVSGSTIVVAGMENGHGIVRRFDLQAGAPPAAAGVRDLGVVQGGIAGVGIDGGSIVLAGSSSNAGLAVGTVNGAYSGGGADAFVAKIALDLAPATSDRLSWFGGAGADSVSAMTVGANGQVWITGSSTADLPGLAPVSTASGSKDGYVARIDADTGAVGWSRRFTATDGQAAPTSIAVDASGASALDRLGLPRGTIDVSDSRLLTANSSLRAGDQFYIRTREGGTKAAVTIEKGDTLDTLATKISRAAGFQVKVSQVRSGDSTVLKLMALNDRSTVEVLAGKPGRNALPALGFAEGVISIPGLTGQGGDKVYGLALADTLNLDTDEGVAAAVKTLGTALSTVRNAYSYIAAPPAAPGASRAGNQSGEVPAYLKNQIANYQAALARLTGGG